MDISQPIEKLKTIRPTNLNLNKKIKFQVKEIEKTDAKEVYSYLLDIAETSGLQDQVSMDKQGFIDILFTKQNGWHGLVATSNNKVIGFVIYSFSNIARFYNSSDCIHIIELFVLEKCRREGVGEKLIKQVSQIAHEQNIQRIDLFCIADNDHINKFYNKLGFDSLNSILLYRKG